MTQEIKEKFKVEVADIKRKKSYFFLPLKLCTKNQKGFFFQLSIMLDFKNIQVKENNYNEIQNRCL